MGLALFGVYCVAATVAFGTACPINLLTGFPCPSCGMTRAMLYAVMGNFPMAFSMHPLFLFAPAVLIMLILGTAMPKLAKSKVFVAMSILMTVALIGVYIYRMIAFYPNREPMEYNSSSLLAWILSLVNK